MPATKSTTPRKELVPPDGGYGWVVCAAYALNNVIVFPILQNFGLIFKDVFSQLGLTGTDISVIMNVNSAFGLLLGLFNGALLRRFGYRKCATVAACLVSLGTALTSFATSFPEFLLFYGIIMSAGFAMGMAAFSYAINTYFKKRRSLAMGFAMTVTGLGPVVLPLLISLSMKEFGARGTSLLLAGLSLHSVAAALLLQPVKRHMRRPEKEPDNAGEIQEETKPAGVEEPEALPMLHERRPSGCRSCAPHQRDGRFEGGRYWARVGSVQSMQSMELGGSVLALDTDSCPAIQEEIQPSAAVAPEKEKQPEKEPEKLPEKASEEAANKHRSLVMRMLGAVASFFDLSLLRDPIYVNLMIGMSMAVFAETNFSLLTPFILSERNFDTQGIASLVSMIAVADIVFRFLAPFIKKLCGQSSRIMYMMGLALLIITRTFLIFAYEYEMVVAVMFALGVAKGIRTVFWLLVIPDYIPIERLPSASGIQSVTNGIVFLALGPLVGVIRDGIGNYNAVIMVINTVTFLTIFTWSVELFIVALRRKRSTKQTDVEKTKCAPT